MLRAVRTPLPQQGLDVLERLPPARELREGGFSAQEPLYRSDWLGQHRFLQFPPQVAVRDRASAGVLFDVIHGTAEGTQ